TRPGDPLVSEVFIEDHDPWWKRILDLGSNILLKWNHVLLSSCLVALVIDPLYFSLPLAATSSTMCIKTDENL
ncbi:unnamed protein product, partial [Musa textilis]